MAQITMNEKIAEDVRAAIIVRLAHIETGTLFRRNDALRHNAGVMSNGTRRVSDVRRELVPVKEMDPEQERLVVDLTAVFESLLLPQRGVATIPDHLLEDVATALEMRSCLMETGDTALRRADALRINASVAAEPTSSYLRHHIAKQKSIAVRDTTPDQQNAIRAMDSLAADLRALASGVTHLARPAVNAVKKAGGSRNMRW